MTVYPETHDWDMLMVGSCLPGLESLWKPGDYIGVQAKVVANAKALVQCLELRGPKWKMVVADTASAEFLRIAQELGIAVATHRWRTTSYGNRSRYERWKHPFNFYPYWKEFPCRAMTLPKIVPDLPAGVPSPRSLTLWREKALLLCIKARKQGFLTSKDFESTGMSITRWVKLGWLRDSGDKVEDSSISKRPIKKYVIDDSKNPPDHGWEDISRQLEEVTS